MAKFHGILGYVQTEETSPGVWTEVKVERPCQGELIRQINQVTPGQHLNPDIYVNNGFSIVADAYAEENFSHIRYITWNGTSWSVSSVEVRRPRLVISVRGVYNG